MARLLILLACLHGPGGGILPDLASLRAAAIHLCVRLLSADRYAVREEAFFVLQCFGEEAVPALRAARKGADLQTGLMIRYLLAHVPRRQESVFIPGGTVRVGTNNPYCGNPERSVLLRPFFMDRFEVTRFMYYLFVRETGHRSPPGWPPVRYPPRTENLPVTRVTVSDALAYARWAGKRLPTAEEWEYAARGPAGFLYPWGDEARKGYGNIDARDPAFKPAEVGTFPKDRSPFGIMDLAGNVREWVLWRTGERTVVPAVKGSSFNMPWSTHGIEACYMPIRKEMDFRSDYLGFRCAHAAKDR